MVEQLKEIAERISIKSKKFPWVLVTPGKPAFKCLHCGESRPFIGMRIGAPEFIAELEQFAGDHRYYFQNVGCYPRSEFE